MTNRMRDPSGDWCGLTRAAVLLDIDWRTLKRHADAGTLGGVRAVRLGDKWRFFVPDLLPGVLGPPSPHTSPTDPQAVPVPGAVPTPSPFFLAAPGTPSISETCHEGEKEEPR